MNRCLTATEIRSFLAATSDATSETGRHLNGCEPCQRLMSRIVRGHQTTDELAAGEFVAFDEHTLPILPGYSFETLLGAGGMGHVWLARQRVPDRLVAVKFFRKSAAVTEVMARVRQEADAAARVQHPNLVTVFEAREESAAGPYLVMEYVRGGTLADRIARGPVEPAQACRWVQTIADAIHTAHSHKVIHRDLKPTNVLLNNDGIPKVSDFGIAQCLEAGGQPSAAGTPHYMAPEQARGGGDCRADVYSLGVILFELLTTIKPFSGNTPAAVLLAQERRTPPLADQALEGVPRAVSVICQKCLHPNPDRRYASAADLAADLGRHLAGRPIQAMPVSRAERGRMWVKRNRGWSLAIVFGVFLSVAIPLLVVWWRNAEEAAVDTSGVALGLLNDQIKNDLDTDLDTPDGDPNAARAFERTAERMRQLQPLLNRAPGSELAHLPAVASDGRRAARLGDWTAAEAAASTCLRELRPVLGQIQPEEARLLNAQLLVARGVALRNLGRLPEATETARTAKADAERRVSPERVAEQARVIRDASFELAACLWLAGQRREADTAYADGVRWAEPLASDPGGDEDRLALAWGLVARTECSGAVADPDRVLAEGNRGCELAEQLSQSRPQSSRLAILTAECRFVVAGNAIGVGDLTVAKSHTIKGVSALRSIRERFPTRFAHSTCEAEGFRLQAYIALCEGHAQRAVELARSAAVSVRACRRVNPENGYVLRQSVFVNDTLADALGAAGQPAEAVAALEEAIRDATDLAIGLGVEDATALALAKRRLLQARLSWRVQPSKKVQEAIGGVAADVLAWAERGRRTEGEQLAAFDVLCDCLLPSTLLTADDAWNLAGRIRSFTQPWGTAPGCSDRAKAASVQADILVGVSHSRCGRTDEAVKRVRQAVAELDRLTSDSSDVELLRRAVETYAPAAAVFRAAGMADEAEQSSRKKSNCRRALTAGR